MDRTGLEAEIRTSWKGIVAMTLTNGVDVLRVDVMGVDVLKLDVMTLSRSLHGRVVQRVVKGIYWFGPARESACLSIYASYKEADTYMLRPFAIQTLWCLLKGNRPSM